MDQAERRIYLIKRLLDERPEYRGAPIPSDAREQKRLLRGLFNLRMPAPSDEDFLKAQDEYLAACASEKGAVAPEQLATVAEGYGSAIPFADKLSLWQGDITRLSVDAIVNAANSQMLGCFQPCHGCIDNCIHTYAGVQLRAECARRMTELRQEYGDGYEQPTAVPMLTDGYNLPAKKIVHVVGPIVSGRLKPEQERQLADCYANTLDLCAENGLRSVAFCCISTGVFGFPQEKAARIALHTVTRRLAERGECFDRVIFNVFTDKDRDIYERLLRSE